MAKDKKQKHGNIENIIKVHEDIQHTQESKMILAVYLSNYSKNRDLDQTFKNWCRHNKFVNKTKSEWDIIFKSFCEETE
jgi:uridine kinase